MRVLKYKDISLMREKIITQNESINPVIGTGENRKVVVKQGLKIRHIPSGLVYTITDVMMPDEGDPVIICHRPGKDLAIHSKDFNEYERL